MYEPNVESYSFFSKQCLWKGGRQGGGDEGEEENSAKDFQTFSIGTFVN